MPKQIIKKEDASQGLLSYIRSMNILSEILYLYTNLKEQENYFASSSGKIILIAHSISIEVDELICAMGISQQGINFISPDSRGCYLILLSITPMDDPTEYRKIITILLSPSIVQYLSIYSSLYMSESSHVIVNIISQFEEDTNRKDYQI